MGFDYRFLIYVICLIFLVDIAYENRSINNILLQIHNNRFSSQKSILLMQDRKHYFTCSIDIPRHCLAVQICSPDPLAAMLF